MLRIGLIGLGGIGRYHLARYPWVSEARVVAVADVRAEALRVDAAIGELFEVPPEHVRWYSDYHELIARGEVDAVDICLPTFLHREAAVAALEAGLDVLCEKPMALTLEDCDAMLEAAEGAERLLMIAHCIRFWPEYRHLAELHESGAAGRLQSLQLIRQGRRPGGDNATWMADARRSGGAIFDLHIHDVDFVHSLLGLPDRVYAQGVRDPGETGGYSHVAAALDYGPNLAVSVAARWVAPRLPFSARYEASFEDAYLSFDSSHQPTLTVYRADGDAPEYPELSSPDAYVGELRYFAQQVLRGQRATRCLARDSRNSVALVHAELASIARGEIVPTEALVRGTGGHE